MLVTKPESTPHSAPQDTTITDDMIDKFVGQFLDKFFQRVDIWEERLGSKIGQIESRVSLLT